MKHLFNDLSSEDKNRILEMHKTASDNLYLSEQVATPPIPRFTERPMAGMTSSDPKLQTAINALNRLDRDSTQVMPYFNDLMNALMVHKGGDLKQIKMAIDTLSQLSDEDRKAVLKSKLGVDL
jgi:hypothetical protein